jgi:hypothetical protein
METPGQVRTSQNTFLNRGADERIEGLERRVHAMTRTWCVRVVWHVPRAVLRVRVEIMGSPKFRSVGKSQCVLIMIDPIVSTRTRTPSRLASPAAAHARGAAGRCRCAVLCEEGLAFCREVSSADRASQPVRAPPPPSDPHSRGDAY